MFPKEERDALAKTLQDTIMELVPGVFEQRVSARVLGYQTPETDGKEVFCLLLIDRDHLEVRFPECPGVVASDGRFAKVDGTDACSLIIRKRTDIPGEILNAAIKDATGVA